MAAQALPGQYLSYEREKRGISVAEVARALRLSEATLATLERDDHARLPEAVYVRGYIRAYCKFLDLDDEPVLALYQDGTTPGHQLLPEKNPKDAVVNEHVQKLTRIWGTIAVLVAVTALLFLWWRDTQEQRMSHTLPIHTGEAKVEVAAEGAIEEGAAEEDAAEEDAAEEDAAEEEEAIEEDAIEEGAVETAVAAQDAAAAQTGSATPGAQTAPGAVPDTTSGDRARSAASEQASPPVAEIPALEDDARYADMKIVAIARSWMLIQDGARGKVIHKIIPAGYEKVFGDLLLPLYFALGDARGIRLWIDDVEYDLSPHVHPLNHTAFFQFDKVPGAQ